MADEWESYSIQKVRTRVVELTQINRRKNEAETANYQKLKTNNKMNGKLKTEPLKGW
jgi:hypothetical protein